MSRLEYRRAISNALVTSFAQVFPAVQTDIPQLSNLNYGIEYPFQNARFPYFLISYAESKIQSSTVSLQEEFDGNSVVRRWSFSGTVSYEMFALSAAERDAMVDGFILIVGMEDMMKAALRDNPYIAVEMNTQTIQSIGTSVASGTPWETDEYVYYQGYSFDVVGEFFSTLSTWQGGLIEAVEIYPRLETDPNLPDNSEGQFV